MISDVNFLRKLFSFLKNFKKILNENFKVICSVSKNFSQAIFIGIATCLICDIIKLAKKTEFFSRYLFFLALWRHQLHFLDLVSRNSKNMSNNTFVAIAWCMLTLHKICQNMPGFFPTRIFPYKHRIFDSNRFYILKGSKRIFCVKINPCVMCRIRVWLKLKRHFPSFQTFLRYNHRHIALNLCKILEKFGFTASKAVVDI